MSEGKQETYELGCVGLPHKDGGKFATILCLERIGEVDNCVATVHGNDEEQVESRAKRIVKAVNSHDQLVKALKNLLRSADVYGTHNMGPAKDQAKTALKVAGEEV